MCWTMFPIIPHCQPCCLGLLWVLQNVYREPKFLHVWSKRRVFFSTRFLNKTYITWQWLKEQMWMKMHLFFVDDVNHVIPNGGRIQRRASVEEVSLLQCWYGKSLWCILNETHPSNLVTRSSFANFWMCMVLKFVKRNKWSSETEDKYQNKAKI